MLDKLKASWRAIAGCAFVLITLYTLAAHVGAMPYAKVCQKGEYGPPDQCASWDIITAIVLRLFVWLDEHNGLVTAFAGSAVAVFTGVLWGSTDKLWKSTHQQFALAQKEFVSTHRPRMRIRRVYFEGISDTEYMPLFTSVVNVGESTATIVSVKGDFYRRKGNRWLGGRPDNSGGRRPPGPDRFFESGDLKTWMVVSSRALEEGEALGTRTGAHELWAIGEIKYADNNETVRATGFAWLYDPSLDDFRRAEGQEDYNYED